MEVDLYLDCAHRSQNGNIIHDSMSWPAEGIRHQIRAVHPRHRVSIPRTRSSDSGHGQGVVAHTHLRPEVSLIADAKQC